MQHPQVGEGGEFSDHSGNWFGVAVEDLNELVSNEGYDPSFNPSSRRPYQ